MSNQLVLVDGDLHVVVDRLDDILLVAKAETSGTQRSPRLVHLRDVQEATQEQVDEFIALRSKIHAAGIAYDAYGVGIIGRVPLHASDGG